MKKSLKDASLALLGLVLYKLPFIRSFLNLLPQMSQAAPRAQRMAGFQRFEKDRRRFLGLLSSVGTHEQQR